MVDRKAKITKVCHYMCSHAFIIEWRFSCKSCSVGYWVENFRDIAILIQPFIAQIVGKKTVCTFCFQVVVFTMTEVLLVSELQCEPESHTHSLDLDLQLVVPIVWGSTTLPSREYRSDVEVPTHLPYPLTCTCYGFRSGPTLRNLLTKAKDPLDKQSNVVYEVPCTCG